jgi:hypothetical protein
MAGSFLTTACGSSLYYATIRHNTDRISKTLTRSPEQANQRFSKNDCDRFFGGYQWCEGNWPLHHAVNHCNAKAVELLLEASADPDAPDRHTRYTAIMLIPPHKRTCTLSETESMLKALISHGASLNSSLEEIDMGAWSGDIVATYTSPLDETLEDWREEDCGEDLGGALSNPNTPLQCKNLALTISILLENGAKLGKRGEKIADGIGWSDILSAAGSIAQDGARGASGAENDCRAIIAAYSSGTNHERLCTTNDCIAMVKTILNDNDFSALCDTSDCEQIVGALHSGEDHSSLCKTRDCEAITETVVTKEDTSYKCTSDDCVALTKTFSSGESHAHLCR